MRPVRLSNVNVKLPTASPREVRILATYVLKVAFARLLFLYLWHSPGGVFLFIIKN